MQIVDILAQTGGLQSMARELGVSETQAASGAAALVPAILGGFKKQAQSQREGLKGSAVCSDSSVAAACSATCWRRSRRT
jgi:hypothetical protein